jgi:signal peptidase I
VPDEYRDNYNMPRTVIPMDKYFVMGDHRSSSNDSRAWGTVARNYIYGKAVLVYWPVRFFGRVQ